MAVDTSTQETGIIVPVLLASIKAGNNDRSNFDNVATGELAESMAAHGLAQPITIRPLDGDSWYEIVAGERRYRAAQSLQWEYIPAIIRNLTDEQAAGIMLAENVHRVDLNPIDEAKAYQKRMQQFAWTVAQIAQAANMTQARVQSRIDLLSFCWEVQSLIQSGNLTLGYAEVMVGLDANSQIIALRYFSQKKRPTLPEFRALCAKLLETQAQESLFDMSAFNAKQEDIKQRQTRRLFPYAINSKLPTMKPARSVDAALEGYLSLLIVHGYKEAAEIVATVYKGLEDANVVRGPRSIERLTGIK